MPSGEGSISVVVPCHNYARFLVDALGSIAGQTRPPGQVILVDDGSTDGSAEIARSVMPGIEVIAQPQRGIAAARNAGMAAATGDLLAFLDADDIWPSESLAVRAAALDTDSQAAGCFGLVDQFLCPMTDDTARARLACPEGRVAARLAGALLLRRSIARQVGPFDPSLTIGETMDWVSRLMALGVRIACVDTLVLRRRIHGSNTTLVRRDYHDYFTLMRAAVHRRAGGTV